MSATIIDELMITLGIDSSKAKQGMQEATSSISSGIKDITSKLGGLTAAFAGLYSVGAAFSEYLSAADAMGKFSDAIGVNIEEMHAWSEAAKRSGGSVEGFQGSLKSLTTQLSKMATMGKSKAGNVLAAVGIDPGELGRQRSAFEVMEEIADKMQEMSKEEAMGFGASLGLDSGTIMLLQQGRDGVKDLVRHQRELGVYTKEDAKATAEFNDAVDDTKQAFMALAATIFREIVPGMKTVIGWVTDFIVILRQNSNTVKIFFGMIAAIITAVLIPAFVNLARAILMNPITWLILLLAGLAIAIDDLMVWMEGGESQFDEFWEALFGSREEAKATFEAIKKNLEMVWEVAKKVFKYIASGQAWRDMKDHANTAWNLIRDRFMIIKRNIEQGFKNLVERVQAPFIRLGEMIDNARRGFDEFCADIVQSFEDAQDRISNEIEYIQNVAAQAWQWIRTKCQEALDWIEQKWNEMKTEATNALNSLLSPIQSVADWIIGIIGGAIDAIVSKWNALKAMISGESAYVNTDMSYLGLKGGGNTNTSNVTFNTTLNGVENGEQAAYDFNKGISRHLKPAQFNAGSY